MYVCIGPYLSNLIPKQHAKYYLRAVLSRVHNARSLTRLWLSSVPRESNWRAARVLYTDHSMKIEQHTRVCRKRV